MKERVLLGLAALFFCGELPAHPHMELVRIYGDVGHLPLEFIYKFDRYADDPRRIVHTSRTLPSDVDPVSVELVDYEWSADRSTKTLHIRDYDGSGVLEDYHVAEYGFEGDNLVSLTVDRGRFVRRYSIEHYDDRKVVYRYLDDELAERNTYWYNERGMLTSNSWAEFDSSTGNWDDEGVVKYLYNDDDQLVGISGGSGPGEGELPPVVISYDDAGNMARVDYDNVSLTLKYDGEGRLIEVDEKTPFGQSAGYVTKYTYDGKKLTSMTAFYYEFDVEAMGLDLSSGDSPFYEAVGEIDFRYGRTGDIELKYAPLGGFAYKYEYEY